MHRLDVKKFGLAFGLTGALIYLGCTIVMTTVGQQGSVAFFNTLLHGLDTSSLIKVNLPVRAALVGIVQIFILGWLVGACIAAFYNVQIKKEIN